MLHNTLHGSSRFRWCEEGEDNAQHPLVVVFYHLQKCHLSLFVTAVASFTPFAKGGDQLTKEVPTYRPPPAFPGSREKNNTRGSVWLRLLFFFCDEDAAELKATVDARKQK